MSSAPFGERLEAFERALDASVEASQFWEAPRQHVLTVLLALVQNGMLGGASVGASPRERAAESLLDRLPALVPLLRRCPTESAQEPGGFSIQGLTDLVEVLTYAHATELYPDLWRGTRVIAECSEPDAVGEDSTSATADAPSAYVVRHASDEAADSEVADIVLGRLAIPWGRFDPKLPSPRAHAASQLNAPGIPPHEVILEIAVMVIGTLTLNELSMVDDAAMRVMVGVERSEFSKFRDACTALGVAITSSAEHCLEQARQTDGEVAEQWAADAMAWSSPLVRAWDLLEWIEVLSGLDKACAKRLIGSFSEPNSASEWQAENADSVIDGFFPPFWPIEARGGDYILLSPWHLQSVVTQHSLVSRYAKVEGDSFDQSVSKSMEPALLEHAAKAWKRVSGAQVVLNESWSCNGARGEFDALVFSESENTVIHVQAKGSIPAVSSRMVARLEKTVMKGLDQLAAVRSLDRDDLDGVLSRALGVDVSHPEVIDVLLISSCVGSFAAWSALGSVTPVNPVLLSAAVESVVESGGLPLGSVTDRASELLDGLINHANPSWEQSSVVLGLGSEAGALSVTFPALSLDMDVIAHFRSLAWPH